MLKSRYIIVFCILFITNIELIQDYSVFKLTDNYLSIPKINLKKNIYEIGELENDVNKNIQLIKNDNNNFILAGHNGNANISYFKNLEKLLIGDLIYFNYDGILRIYELKKTYEIEKNGYFKIEKYQIPVINLITCKNNSDTLQVVYVGYLLK